MSCQVTSVVRDPSARLSSFPSIEPAPKSTPLPPAFPPGPAPKAALRLHRPAPLATLRPLPCGPRPQPPLTVQARTSLPRDGSASGAPRSPAVCGALVAACKRARSGPAGAQVRPTPPSAPQHLPGGTPDGECSPGCVLAPGDPGWGSAPPTHLLARSPGRS